MGPLSDYETRARRRQRVAEGWQTDENPLIPARILRVYQTHYGDQWVRLGYTPPYAGVVWLGPSMEYGAWFADLMGWKRVGLTTLELYSYLRQGFSQLESAGDTFPGFDAETQEFSISPEVVELIRTGGWQEQEP